MSSQHSEHGYHVRGGEIFRTRCAQERRAFLDVCEEAVLVEHETMIRMNWIHPVMWVLKIRVRHFLSQEGFCLSKLAPAFEYLGSDRGIDPRIR